MLTVKVVRQKSQSAGAFKFRVEINDGKTLGLGYGDHRSDAYTDARDSYHDNLLAQVTERMSEADRAFYNAYTEYEAEIGRTPTPDEIEQGCARSLRSERRRSSTT